MGKGDNPSAEVYGILGIHIFPHMVATITTSDGEVRQTSPEGFINYTKPLGTNLHFLVESSDYQPIEFDFVFNCLQTDKDLFPTPLVNDNDLFENIDSRYDVIDKNLFEDAILIQDQSIVYQWGDPSQYQDNLASVVRSWVNLIWGCYIKDVGFDTLDRWCRDLPSATAQTINADMAVSNLLSYTTPHTWIYSGGEDKDGIARWPKQFQILEQLFNKSCPEVFNERIAQPLGSNYQAWMISDGTMRISSTIRDLYKLARLLFNKGNWNGVQLIDERYVERTLAGGPNGNGIPYPLEGYQTHLIRNGSAWEMENALPGVPDGFMARSSKSYIIGIPSLKLIMCGKGPEQLQSVFLPQICNLMRV